MSKKNTTTLAFAVETITRFKQLVVDLNDEMKKRNLIFLHMSAEKVFEPTADDFKSFKTATEYLNAFRHKFTSKITMDEITFLLDLSSSELAGYMCTKAEFDEFKKNGYDHLRAKWLVEQKKLVAAKAAAKQNNADAIKRKIAKLQAQLDKLVA